MLPGSPSRDKTSMLERRCGSREEEIVESNGTQYEAKRLAAAA